MSYILDKLEETVELSYEDAVELLNTELLSVEYYNIINKANLYSRNAFGGKGVIFSQIGMDSAPCAINCKFCQLAVDNFNEQDARTMDIDDIVKQAVQLVSEGTDEIFLMSTAQIDREYFLEVGSAVRQVIPKDMKMVANTGDFDETYAHKLMEAGFTGVYHICRLGEEKDTDAKIETRIHTLDAIKKAKLELYYCVEPIGPEHSSEEIAKEIFRAKDYDVNVMAVMRRVNFEGSPMHNLGEISAIKMALICAVSVLVVKPDRAMGVHEPEIISLISGANQIYAEMGSNPRDTKKDTQNNRGFSVQKAKKMLQDADWNS